jgi:molybdopterin converting factor small subunit
MGVQVKFHGYLRERMGTDGIDVDAQQTVAELIDFLHIPSQLSMLPVVNGQIVEMDYLLQEGDHFELIPPIEGGR